MASNSWIEYLNDPCLVARFQEYFGIKKVINVNRRRRSKKVTTEGLAPRSSSSLPKNYTISLTSENLRERSVRGGEDTEFLGLKAGDACQDSGISSCGSATNSNTSLSTNDDGSNEKEEDEADDESPVTSKDDFVIQNRFWYYLFSFGSALGDEVFYACFFPFWFWNIDGAVCRRVVLIWGILMYIGQGLKDIIRWPRPACPPVVRLESKWALEYAMPSTHAIVASAVPFSILFFTSSRYQYPFVYGLVIAIAWITLVGMSRIYLGMHSVLGIMMLHCPKSCMNMFKGGEFHWKMYGRGSKHFNEDYGEKAHTEAELKFRRPHPRYYYRTYACEGAAENGTYYKHYFNVFTRPMGYTTFPVMYTESFPIEEPIVECNLRHYYAHRETELKEKDNYYAVPFQFYWKFPKNKDNDKEQLAFQRPPEGKVYWGDQTMDFADPSITNCLMTNQPTSAGPAFDILAGLSLVAVLFSWVIPLVDWLDPILLKHQYGGLYLLLGAIVLAACSPGGDRWTPARGDTIVILGTCAGLNMGAWMNYQLGIIRGPPIDPPYPVIWPSFAMLGLSLLRLVIGLAVAYATKAAVKSSAILALRGLLHDKTKPNVSNATKKEVIVELTYKFLTYLSTGFNVVYLSPVIFRLIGIERPTFHTEV